MWDYITRGQQQSLYKSTKGGDDLHLKQWIPLINQPMKRDEKQMERKGEHS